LRADSAAVGVHTDAKVLKNNIIESIEFFQDRGRDNRPSPQDRLLEQEQADPTKRDLIHRERPVRSVLDSARVRGVVDK
jgi:hypothetical protein